MGQCGICENSDDLVRESVDPVRDATHWITTQFDGSTPPFVVNAEFRAYNDKLLDFLDLDHHSFIEWQNNEFVTPTTKELDGRESVRTIENKLLTQAMVKEVNEANGLSGTNDKIKMIENGFVFTEEQYDDGRGNAQFERRFDILQRNNPGKKYIAKPSFGCNSNGYFLLVPVNLPNLKSYIDRIFTKGQRRDGESMMMAKDHKAIIVQEYYNNAIEVKMQIIFGKFHWAEVEDRKERKHIIFNSEKQFEIIADGSRISRALLKRTLFDSGVCDKMKEQAEGLSRVLKAPRLRVDFFVKKDGSGDFVINELAFPSSTRLETNTERISDVPFSE